MKLVVPNIALFSVRALVFSSCSALNSFKIILVAVLAVLFCYRPKIVFTYKSLNRLQLSTFNYILWIKSFAAFILIWFQKRISPLYFSVFTSLYRFHTDFSFVFFLVGVYYWMQCGRWRYKTGELWTHRLLWEKKYMREVYIVLF